MTEQTPSPETVPQHGVAHIPENNNIPRAFFYKQLFKPEECGRIINAPIDSERTQQYILAQQQFMQGYAQYMHADIQLLAAVSENQWVFEFCHKLMRVLNDRDYHFDVKDLCDTQVLTLKPGMHIGMHFDLGNGPFSKRKLGMVVFLSPEDHYTGGGYDMMTNGVYSARRQQGSIAVFPAYYVTGFKAVTSGEQKVLLTWLDGPDRFR